MLKFCLLKIFYLSNIFFNTELLIISKINENKLIILRLTAKINTWLISGTIIVADKTSINSNLPKKLINVSAVRSDVVIKM